LKGSPALDWRKKNCEKDMFKKKINIVSVFAFASIIYLA